MSYQLHYPRKVVFGWDTRRELPAILAEALGREGGRYVLVAGPSDRNDAVVEECREILGAPAGIYRSVTPDPELADVDGLAELIRTVAPDAVVAIGGGSAMDVAKAGAIIGMHDDDTVEYFYGRSSFERAGLPLILLPTTAGTGTEITRNSVLTDPATKIKQSIRHPSMVAAAAIVDPHYTLTCPAHVTAASGLDALTQAIESYISAKATAATRPLAREAVRLIWPALPRGVADGSDRDARAAMAEGSMLTGLAFAQSGLGAVHGLAHPLGSLLKVTHGQTCAILLPHVLRYNASAAAADLDDLAHDLGLACRNCLIAEITGMLKTFGIPATFAPLGLRPEHFPFILENCRSNSMRCTHTPLITLPRRRARRSRQFAAHTLNCETRKHGEQTRSD